MPKETVTPLMYIRNQLKLKLTELRDLSTADRARLVEMAKEEMQTVAMETLS